MVFIRIFAVVVCFWTVSIGAVYLNKVIITDSQEFFPAPLFLASFQCIVACLMCRITVFLSNHSGRFRLTVFHQVPSRLRYNPDIAYKILPLTILFVGMIGTNNMCLQYVPVAFFNVARSLTVLLVFAADRWQDGAAATAATALPPQPVGGGGRKPRGRSTSSEAAAAAAAAASGSDENGVEEEEEDDDDDDEEGGGLKAEGRPARRRRRPGAGHGSGGGGLGWGLGAIATGFALGHVSQAEWNLRGGALGVLSSVFVAAHSVWVDRALRRVGGDTWSLTYHNNFSGSLLLATAAILKESQTIVEHWQKLLSWRYWAVATLCGSLCYLVGVVTYVQIQVTSPLTHIVSSSARGALQSAIAFKVWRGRPNATGVTGTALVLLGSALYTRARGRDAAAPGPLLAPPPPPKEGGGGGGGPPRRRRRRREDEEEEGGRRRPRPRRGDPPPRRSAAGEGEEGGRCPGPRAIKG